MRTPPLPLASLAAALPLAALAAAALAPPALAAPAAAPAAPAAAPPADPPSAIAAALRALPRRAEIGGALPLAFVPRPRLDAAPRAAGARGALRLAAALAEAPVSVRFAAPPTAADLDALAAAGARVLRRPDGSPQGRGPVVLARLPAAAVAPVAALPGVVRVALDGSPFRPPPPLDLTTREIQATDARLQGAAAPSGLTGAGVTICDIDTGVDPFHPLLFRADGGYFDWIDLDADGVFTPGVDGLDRDADGQPEVLRVLDSVITNYWDNVPRDGSDDPAFAAGMDWLYADLDGSGARDLGPQAGFTEADPTYGEPLFVVDDVNADGVLGPGERLVALGTSKVKAIRRNEGLYLRGTNLIDLPRGDEIAHGTGAAGVLLGGAPGLTRLVGIAPGAELVAATLTETGQELALTHFCLDQGARVVLHEYAPWTGYHLDGSGDLERLIDDTVQEGVSHVNPAGNLSGSQKLFKRSFPAGDPIQIDIEAPVDSPYGEFRVFVTSFLWRDTARDLLFHLEDPDGFSMDLSTGKDFLFTDWKDGLKVYAGREDSGRGTARLDLFVFGQTSDPPPIPLGTWKLTITDPSPPGSPDLDLIGYVQDELSGWGLGLHFPDHPSEDHLVGYPGTADFGLAVSATTGHGWNGGTPGTRAGYSGRGHRIDGAPLLWISAPDDPITAGYRAGAEARYFVYGGTSGASPHVAGAAALLLEADPARTGADVREAIRAGALVDEAVGAVPNDDYGHGKLRIYQSLHGAPPPGGSPPSISVAPTTVRAGESTAIAVSLSDPDEPATSLLVEADRDYDGTYETPVEGGVLRLTFPSTGQYTIRLRARDTTGRESGALAALTVIQLADPLVASGGCAVGGRSGDPLWAAGAAGLLALRKRRRQASR